MMFTSHRYFLHPFIILMLVLIFFLLPGTINSEDPVAMGTRLYYAEKPMSPNLKQMDHSGYVRNRTAVIITGQLRSGNVSFTSKNVSANDQMFGQVGLGLGLG
jgi:hypothetical protein